MDPKKGFHGNRIRIRFFLIEFGIRDKLNLQIRNPGEWTGDVGLRFSYTLLLDLFKTFDLIFLYAWCAPCSELPYNISTTRYTFPAKKNTKFFKFQDYLLNV